MKKFENYIKKKFEISLPKFIYQKRIKKYTVDWFCSTEELTIILECDEKCHLDRNFLYEMYRVYNIMKILDLSNENKNHKYLFIKFNPDSLCHHKGKFRFKKKNQCIDNQIRLVLNLIRNTRKQTNFTELKKFKIAFIYSINPINYWFEPIPTTLKEFCEFCKKDINITISETKETSKKLIAKSKNKICMNKIILSNGDISIIKYKQFT